MEKKDKSKLVSVIIPTYSRPDNLKRAIDSVINQSYKSIEIIVVDDNGEGTAFQKQTEKVVQLYLASPDFKYIPHKVNKNGSAARNTGITNAQGDYIGFLDDDDEFCSGKIEKQVATLESLPEQWGGCYCNTLNHGRFKTSFVHNSKEGNLTDDLLLMKVTMNSSTLLLRREVCFELNGFDESFRRHQDWEFLIRFFRKYKMALADESHFLIKKYTSKTTSNIPLGEKAWQYRTHFLKTYEKDISASPYCAQILKHQWLDMARAAIAFGDHWSLIRRQYNKAGTYEKLNVKDYAGLMIAFLKRLCNKIKG